VKREVGRVKCVFLVQTCHITKSIKKIIDTLTGQQGRRAGDSFGLVTEYVEASRILNHERYGSRIVLVDTPGFDDSVVSDRQTLELIGKWLKKTYVEMILVTKYYP